MKNTMKALVLTQYNQFEYKDMPMPKIEADEVLLQVKACAVCGSDLHGINGSTGRRIPPIVMGHEAAGVIVQLGSEVKDYSVGQRVTFDSTQYCGSCMYCQSGRMNLCSNRRVYGVSCEEYKKDGAFAQYIAVKQHLLYLLPPQVSFVQATLVEPLSVALHAIGRVSLKPADTAVVIGAGTIGLMILAGLKAFGVQRVIVLDIDDQKLDMAKKLGADAVLNSAKEDAEAFLHKENGGEGANCCFDAVGIAATLALTLSCLCKGGAAVLVGNLAPKVEFALQTAVTREISLFGSCASAGEYAKSLELMAQGAIDTDVFIGQLLPLSKAAQRLVEVKDQSMAKIILLTDEEA